MNLAFGILSARELPGSIVQLVDALGPGAYVTIHHDESKSARPALRRDNVRFVDRTVRTAWGEWSLCEAVLRLMRTALEDSTWGYFQLLSGSCLPIKPIEAFRSHVASTHDDVNMDLVALDNDPPALMSHGFRAYAPLGSVQHRVLRRLRRWHLGGDPDWNDREGLGFALRRAQDPITPGARLALAVMRRLSRGPLPCFGHPFDLPRRRCFVGSTWWGARRAVCEYLVSQPAESVLQRYFQDVLIPDEFYFQTLIGNAGCRIAASNHLISRFDESHPVRLAVPDLPTIDASPRFFARKFPDDPRADVRAQVMARIASTTHARSHFASAH
jgi:hypothetical protein